MNVLVIPEDSRKDKYILKPLFRSLFRAIGKRTARVRVCEDPVLGGIGEALKSSRMGEIVRQHGGMTSMFILCVDRDGELHRRDRLRALEREFGDGRMFFAENAWEELETWVLAGLELPDGWRWRDVRAEVQVKERYFDRVAHDRGVYRAGRRPEAAWRGGRRPNRRHPPEMSRGLRQPCPTAASRGWPQLTRAPRHGA